MTTKRKRNKPKAVYTPVDREVIKAVKQATCKVYEISEDDLLTNVSTSVAHLRFYCFWLLKSAEVNENVIADAFGLSRTGIIYGIEQVDCQKNIYRETVSQLRMIAEATNEFPKKYEWHIQLTNTTN